MFINNTYMPITTTVVGAMTLELCKELLLKNSEAVKGFYYGGCGYDNMQSYFRHLLRSQSLGLSIDNFYYAWEELFGDGLDKAVILTTGGNFKLAENKLAILLFRSSEA